jgi:RNA-directed DNA polymerase
LTWHKAPKLRIAPTSLKRQDDKIREVLKGARGRSLTTVIAELNPILRGWMAYFKLTETKQALEEMDGWIRRKLRCMLWRQWKRPYTRAKNLMKAGLTGRTRVALGVQPTRAVVEQWRKPHEPSLPEVFL